MDNEEKCQITWCLFQEMHPESLNLPINNVNKENSFCNLYGIWKKRRYSSINHFYIEPQAIWKEHFQDLAHNPIWPLCSFLPLQLLLLNYFLRIQRNLWLKRNGCILFSSDCYIPTRSLLHTQREKWSGTLLEINRLKQLFLVLVL